MTSDLGPVVGLDDTDEQWSEYYDDEGDTLAEEDNTTWNDPEGTWVLDIARQAANAIEARAEVHRQWEIFKEKVLANRFDDEMLMAGVEKVYSTSKAAEFFGRSTQWMYWGLRPDPKTGETPFAYKDGTPILPERIGTMGKRRFTLPLIKEIALCCYRRGSFTEDELEGIMEKILLAEFGRSAFSGAR
jgi:hypothetical protein